MPLPAIATATPTPSPESVQPTSRFSLSPKDLVPPGGSPRPPAAIAPPPGGSAAQILDRVRTAQAQLDRILALAQSGKTFTAAELLALQGQVYRASQEIDLASRVVEKGTGGVKQVLQTQV